MRTALFALLLAACGGAATAPVAVEGRRVDVLISGSGYTPDQIEAKPGEALTLVFQRNDANNCGGEVVFPDNPELKKLEIPVGKEVAVSLKAPASGELAFTCGMAMYEGSLVVAAN